MSDEGNPGVRVDGKLVVTDLVGLGKAVEKLTPAALKLVEAIQAGAAKLYEPASLYLNSRAENAAKRHNALEDAKAYLEMETRSPAVLQAMRERILGVEYRREENIQKAQVEATKVALANTSAEANDIDPDFYVEWTEGVKDISHEELRSAWAKILGRAPEHARGRVPKPVVDFLRQLDAGLAEEMRYVYENVIPSTCMMPYNQAMVSELGAEVGIGSHVSLRSFSMFRGWLYLTFDRNPATFFELSARARELCSIIFPARADEDRRSVAMLENLHEWLDTVTDPEDTVILTVSLPDKRKLRFKIVMKPENEVVWAADLRTVERFMEMLPTATPIETALRDGMERLRRQVYVRAILE